MENRGGNFVNNLMVGTVVPIMQFANSDIEDLKIVEEEPPVEKPTVPVQPTPPPPPPQRQPSIHDDPAIVQAVVSSSKKDFSSSHPLADDLQRLKLSNEQSTNVPKTAESRPYPDSGELNPSWSSMVSSGNRSKFFDRPQSTHSEATSFNRSQPTWSTQSSSTSRQPMPSYPQQNGHMQQRYNPRRSAPSRPQRRMGGGNRETFNDNGNNYDDDFDFESSNQKFNKIASEDEFKQQSESPHQLFQQPMHDPRLNNSEYEPIYDKKKSFFDHSAAEDIGDASAPMYNRTRNQDTFGYDRYSQQQQRNRGGYRRGNNQYRQQGNENYSYRQNNNGYNYQH